MARTTRSRARPAPVDAPPEPPTALSDDPGERLRQAREARGLSLAEVSRETCIGERYLTAIETGEYAPFRSVVYIIGFARSFARAVGADEGWVVARMREETIHLRRDLELSQPMEIGRRRRVRRSDAAA